MRDRRTVTIENSAVTKNALIAISNITDNNLKATSVKLKSGLPLTAKACIKGIGHGAWGIGHEKLFQFPISLSPPSSLSRCLPCPPCLIFPTPHSLLAYRNIRYFQPQFLSGIISQGK